MDYIRELDKNLDKSIRSIKIDEELKSYEKYDKRSKTNFYFSLVLFFMNVVNFFLSYFDLIPSNFSMFLSTLGILLSICIIYIANRNINKIKEKNVLIDEKSVLVSDYPIFLQNLPNYIDEIYTSFINLKESNNIDDISKSTVNKVIDLKNNAKSDFFNYHNNFVLEKELKATRKSDKKNLLKLSFLNKEYILYITYSIVSGALVGHMFLDLDSFLFPISFLLMSIILGGILYTRMVAKKDFSQDRYYLDRIEKYDSVKNEYLDFSRYNKFYKSVLKELSEEEISKLNKEFLNKIFEIKEIEQKNSDKMRNLKTIQNKNNLKTELEIFNDW